MSLDCFLTTDCLLQTQLTGELSLGVCVYCFRNVMAHGDAREGKWRGNWRMEWVASTLTRPRNVVYPPLLTLMRTPRLPAVDWTDSPADWNGLVRLGERRNVVSARVPLGSEIFKERRNRPENQNTSNFQTSVRRNQLTRMTSSNQGQWLEHSSNSGGIGWK